ncbi:MAG: acyltransferase, partial [Moraxellaceae bacterium]|nr:acyltransferase [Moraxellaceae bacterium]
PPEPEPASCIRPCSGCAAWLRRDWFSWVTSVGKLRLSGCPGNWGRIRCRIYTQLWNHDWTFKWRHRRKPKWFYNGSCAKFNIAGNCANGSPIIFLDVWVSFFVGFDWSTKNYIEKLKSRAKTLLIPFLFWNIITLALLAFAQTLPAAQGYFSGKNALIASFNASDYMTVIFGIGRSPIAYQFWFIRDLMILVLLTPIIFYLGKKAPLPFVCILFFCWFAGFWPIFTPSSAATFFFVMGSLLAIKRKSLFATDPYGSAIAAAYIVILIVDVILIKSEFHLILHKTGIIFGVLTVLFLTKWVASSRALKNFLLPLAGVSFFVFAAHEPLLYVARKVLYKLIEPDSTYSVLGLYFAIPIMVIMILIFAHRVLSSLFPNAIRIITGGR